MPLYCQSCGADARISFKFCPICGGKQFDAQKPGIAQAVATGTGSTPPTTVDFGIDVSGMSYASPGRRFLAFVLDVALVNIVAFVILITLVEVAPSLVDFMALLLMLSATFFWVLSENGTHQATPGKRALGLVVAGMDGGRISKWRAFFHLLLVTSMWFLVVPSLFIFFTGRRQTLQDIWSGAVVMYRGN